ncbi:hypothetical protein KODAMA_00500 [Serratia phage vB_SmaM-Kodama]|nr:hypothetical protein KODAMA_00500 [Serratia phage vB_SmaM-Kodama]
MKFPENKANVKKVTDLISASLARAKSQLQPGRVEVISEVTPFERDPWKLISSRFVGFELPDGYIVPRMVQGTKTYQPDPDRISMAREGLKEMKLALLGLGIQFHENDSETNHEVFWENVYTWTSEIVWVDKVVPEDIVCKVLFDKAPPVIANRISGTAIGDVSKLLRGMVFYDKATLVAKFPDYLELPTNMFMVDGLKVSVFRTGNGYANGTTPVAINNLAAAESVSRSVVGYLNLQLTETERGTYLQQSWFARISALAQSSVFGNLYWSYVLRGLGKQ